MPISLRFELNEKKGWTIHFDGVTASYGFILIGALIILALKFKSAEAIGALITLAVQGITGYFKKGQDGKGESHEEPAPPADPVVDK